MKLRILRNYGDLKKDQIIDVDESQKHFLLGNQIACVAPKNDGCNGECDECDECDDCKGKSKKTVKTELLESANKQSTKKKTTKKTAPKQ